MRMSSRWQGLFWEGDGGALVERALANADKPIRISAAALVLRAAAVQPRQAVWQVPAAAAYVLEDAQLCERRAVFLARLPELELRARSMLQATSAVQHAQVIDPEWSLSRALVEP
jgi:hypothetical protein